MARRAGGTVWQTNTVHRVSTFLAAQVGLLATHSALLLDCHLKCRETKKKLGPLAKQSAQRNCFGSSIYFSGVFGLCLALIGSAVFSLLYGRLHLLSFYPCLFWSKKITLKITHPLAGLCAVCSSYMLHPQFLCLSGLRVFLFPLSATPVSWTLLPCWQPYVLPLVFILKWFHTFFSSLGKDLYWSETWSNISEIIYWHKCAWIDLEWLKPFLWMGSPHYNYAVSLFSLPESSAVSTTL